jgi:hypothetical protein
MLKEVIHVNKRFLLASRGLWQVIGLLFKRNFHMPLMHPVLTTHGKII